MCAGIGAWNYPLQGAAWKVAPALACGNAIVFKPSERTPLTAYRLTSILHEAGLPAGCFSVLLGDGSTGQALATHPDVAKVSFTGSVATGKAVYRSAADRMASVTMELGGKSPLIVMEDSDIGEAVAAAMVANWYSAGQVCSNGTRVFVHSTILPAFLDELVARTSRMQIGHPFDDETDMGPLVCREHFETVQAYVRLGVDEGATLFYGGDEVTVGGECSSAAFMRPAIFTDCRDDMRIVREEVFGPVMCVLPFDTEAEVLARANDTPFGLAAGVFTRDLQRAHRMVAGLHAGTTWINNYNLAPAELPWRGFRQSGLGQENGLAVVNHWTREKSVYVEMGRVDTPYTK